MKKRFLWIISLFCIFTLAVSVGVTAFASSEPVVYNSDQLIAAGLYNTLDASKGMSKLQNINGVVSSSGDGHMLCDEELDGVDMTIRFTSGSSTFIVLRATQESAIWDGGLGYFLMLDKAATGTQVRIIKGVSEQANGDFVTLDNATIETNVYDGEKHTFRYVALDVDNKVELSVSIDGAEVITATDSENICTKANTHFVMLSAANQVMYKLYSSTGEDIETSNAEYTTITSKTMLSKASNWLVDGAVLSEGTVIGNRDQSKVLFNRELKGVVYDFDILMDIQPNSWLAIYLNANKADVPWNDGFRSVMVRFELGAIHIEYWNPQQSVAVIDVKSTNIKYGERMNVKAGLYQVPLKSGNVTFVMLNVNGEEIYNAPLGLGSSAESAGYFGLVNYGLATYTLYPTENEVDEIPSATDGIRIEREEEAGITNSISVEDFAIIANSFDPYYSYEDDVMTVANNGYNTYKNSINFSKITLKFRFEDANKPGQMAEFAFGKKRQNSIVGARLADDYTNYGYMIRVAPSGNVMLVKTDNGANMKTLMNYDCASDFGITFEDLKWHTFTLYRSVTNEGMKISLFVDDNAYGYYAVDTDYYAPNYPMESFIGFGNTAQNSKYFVKDIKFEGTETDVASKLPADAVNFVSYFEKDGEEFVYFCFDSASYTAKWVEIYASDASGAEGELLGRVFPKNTTFNVTEYDCEYVIVKTVGFTDENSKTELLKLEEQKPLFEDTSKVKRIAIKSSENGAYFVYEGTNEEYRPVGGNYMGLRGGDHSTFDAATSFTEADYDPNKAESMMKNFSKNGGNVLRVFLIGRTSTNPGISGDPSYDINDTKYFYEGLYKPYMENVVHFLRTAQKYGVYVMLTLGDADVPSNKYYMDLQGGVSLARNYMYFDAKGVNARKTYAKNVMSYFATQAPDCVSGIFSIELQNEFAVYGDQWPFNLTSGKVTIANGKEYDMGDVDSRELCFREGVTYYINQVYSGIKSVDKNVLVNEGSFTRNIVGNNHVYGMTGINSGDIRLPATFDIYLKTNIDFLDVHIYYANTRDNTVLNSFADDLQYMNFWTDEVQNLLKEKPLFMGEFGPNARIFKDPKAAEDVWTETVRLATESGFKGFAVWTLESHNQTECWNILADDGKFDLFRELVRIHMGVENTDGITAESLTVNVGEAWTPAVSNTLDGDKITYFVNGVEVTEFVFNEAGEYTVSYTVERRFAETFNGTFKVTVMKDDIESGDVGGKPAKSCGGSLGAESAMIIVAIAACAVAIVSVKRKYSL